VSASTFLRRSGLDASRTDLAREFRRDPFGFHSPDLQYLVSLMRALPAPGKHMLVTVTPGQEWVLARLGTGDPPRVERFDDIRFHRIEDAEWHVFQLRWEAIFGVPLALD
jgi:hypothetical protein